jgi:inward rectifier potassium channel
MLKKHHKNTAKAMLPTATGTSALRLEKVGIREFDFTDPYHLALTMTWPQFFAALLVLYLAINFLFALLYFVVPGSVVNLPPGSLTDAFFFSIETLATVGYGNMAPITLYAHTVSTIEIFVGMLLTATMTGLVFVRFSKPKAKLLFAQQVAVSRKNGVHRLMVRVGNGRMNALNDANVRISTLTDSMVDGQLFRSLVEVKLVRADIPFFPMTWTVIHEISEDSPLAYLRTVDPAGLQASHIRLMVSMTARDPALGAQVYATHNYGAKDIALDMRYADAITASDHDHSVADMRKISEMEPETFPMSGSH